MHILKLGLRSLPTPRNDFEMVIPENKVLAEGTVADEYLDIIEDASDIEERNAQQICCC